MDPFLPMSGECTPLQPRSLSWNVLLVVWLQWKKYAFHKVKFRKLQINYILIFLRKIFQLKTAQSQLAFHFEANLFLNWKHMTLVDNLSASINTAAPLRWASETKVLLFNVFSCVVFWNIDKLDFLGVWNIRAAKSTIKASNPLN